MTMSDATNSRYTVLGIEEPTEGTIQKARNLRLGYLPQKPVLHSERTLYAEMLSVFDDLRQQQAALLALADEMDAIYGVRNGLYLEDNGLYRKIVHVTLKFEDVARELMEFRRTVVRHGLIVGADKTVIASAKKILDLRKICLKRLHKLKSQLNNNGYRDNFLNIQKELSELLQEVKTCPERLAIPG